MYTHVYGDTVYINSLNY